MLEAVLSIHLVLTTTILPIPPFHRWVNWGPGRLSNLSKVMHSELPLKVSVLEEFKNKQGERKAEKKGWNYWGRKGGKKKKLTEHLLWARLHLAIFFSSSLCGNGWYLFHLQIRELRHGTVNKVVKVSWVTEVWTDVSLVLVLPTGWPWGSCLTVLGFRLLT